jgi:hypothetical protein
MWKVDLSRAESETMMPKETVALVCFEMLVSEISMHNIN